MLAQKVKFVLTICAVSAIAALSVFGVSAEGEVATSAAQMNKAAFSTAVTSTKDDVVDYLTVGAGIGLSAVGLKIATKQGIGFLKSLLGK